MVIGDNQRGIVLCVWMSDAYGNSVLTKTLKKDIRNFDSGDDFWDSPKPFKGEYEDSQPIAPVTVDSLIENIYEIINTTNWKDVSNIYYYLFVEEVELFKIYISLSNRRTDDNYVDIFRAMLKGIETAAERGVKIKRLTDECNILLRICGNDSDCIDVHKSFIENLNSQYDDIET